MAADEISVNTLSIDDLKTTLQVRLDETFAAMRALSQEPGSRAPALGTFADATVTTQRYNRLHQQYVDRLQRLVVALTAVQTASVHISERFDKARNQARANASNISSALNAVSEAVDGGSRGR